MSWLYLLAHFAGGVTLMNASPHIISAVLGQAFETPFAKPPHVGLSAPWVNCLWGSFNLTISYFLIFKVGSFDLHNALDAASFGLGILLFGLVLSRHFGRLHRRDQPTAEVQGAD